MGATLPPSPPVATEEPAPAFLPSNLGRRLLYIAFTHQLILSCFLMGLLDKRSFLGCFFFGVLLVRPTPPRLSSSATLTLTSFTSFYPLPACVTAMKERRASRAPKRRGCADRLLHPARAEWIGEAAAPGTSRVRGQQNWMPLHAMRQQMVGRLLAPKSFTVDPTGRGGLLLQSTETVSFV